MADKVKLSLAALLLIGGIVGFYYFSQQALPLRVLGLLAVAVVAVVIAFRTAQGSQALAFIQDAQIEVRKVVWPTGKETMQTTLIVMVMVIVVAIFLWVVDAILLWAVKLLTGQGG